MVFLPYVFQPQSFNKLSSGWPEPILAGCASSTGFVRPYPCCLCALSVLFAPPCGRAALSGPRYEGRRWASALLVALGVAPGANRRAKKTVRLQKKQSHKKKARSQRPGLQSPPQKNNFTPNVMVRIPPLNNFWFKKFGSNGNAYPGVVVAVVTPALLNTLPLLKL